MQKMLFGDCKTNAMTNLPVSWNLPPEPLQLPEGNVHIWQIQLDVPEETTLALTALLSKDELERADRFHFAEHRARFITGRGCLRILLSRYLHQDPEHIRFRYNTFGKPEVDDAKGLGTVHFNLTHSNGLALLAIAKSGAIGIDLEFVQDKPRLEDTGPIVFAPAELAALNTLNPAERRTMFFQYWTRKEAYIKALGKGFALPLHQIDVSQAPLKPVSCPESSVSGHPDWYLTDFVPQPGYIAALATPGKDWQISTYR